MKNPHHVHNINNFEEVNLDDYANWGTELDLLALGAYTAPNDTQPVVGSVNFHLNRHRTAPLDWTLYVKRELYNSVGIIPANVGLRIATATGGAGYNFLYQSLYQNYPFIDNVGRCLHLVAEDLRADVVITQPAPFGTPPEIDKLRLWISRGRPCYHTVRLFVVGPGVNPATTITIPPFAVSASIMGYGGAGFARVNCAPRFLDTFGGTVATNSILATDNNNEIVIPTGATQLTETAANTRSFVTFKCFS